MRATVFSIKSVAVHAIIIHCACTRIHMYMYVNVWFLYAIVNKK